MSNIEIADYQKEKAINKLELLIEDLKKNKAAEEESGKSYFNTNLFDIRVNEILKILKDGASDPGKNEN